VVALLSLFMFLGPSCRGNCDGQLYVGAITVYLEGSTRTGSGTLKLCLDDMCWTGDASDAVRNGAMAFDESGQRPVPGQVTFLIGSKHPRTARATLKQADQSTQSEVPLTLTEEPHGSCHRTTYRGESRYDLSAATFRS
jgi:hypothetical protein